MFSQDLHENSKYYYLSHKVCLYCIMKEKNAVFLRNKMYCQLEAIGLEGLCKHESHTRMEKYVEGFTTVRTCTV